jgi:hypothetical protein
MHGDAFAIPPKLLNGNSPIWSDFDRRWTIGRMQAVTIGMLYKHASIAKAEIDD